MTADLAAARRRAWVMTALFIGASAAVLVPMYLWNGCAYETNTPTCSQSEEVVATPAFLGGYALLLVGVVFLVRAVVLELRTPTRSI